MDDRKPLLHQDLPRDIAELLRAGREDAPPANGAENATLDGALRAVQATSRVGIRAGAPAVVLTSVVVAISLCATLAFRRFGEPAARPAEPSATPAPAPPAVTTTAPGPEPAESPATTTEIGVGVLALPDALPLKPSSDDTSDDGLAVIDHARGALASGHPTECLGRLAHYRAAYPRHAYDEEAYALEVQALAALERRDEAKAKAGVFFSRYPRSPYAARLRAALGGEP